MTALFDAGFRIRLTDGARARDAQASDIAAIKERPQAWKQFDHVPRGLESEATDRWEKLYAREPRGERLVHVHVRAAGRPNQRYALLFRDYLRTHPAAAASYGDFKFRLAALGVDTETYSDIKDPVCDLIMISAEKWAGLVSWSVD